FPQNLKYFLPHTITNIFLLSQIGVHSGEFQAHTMRVMTGLDELINKLHSPAVLDSMLAHLAEQHALRDGVTHELFHVFRDVMYDSLGQLLDEYNPDAWRNCMFHILYGIAGALP
ncbi:hypothetical protein GH868_29545, partial [Bacillus thuringiensis]|nr:hypothetical protein [Bacillus thuringiensis]